MKETKPKGLAKIWREVKRPFKKIGREVKRVFWSGQESGQKHSVAPPQGQHSSVPKTPQQGFRDSCRGQNSIQYRSYYDLSLDIRNTMHKIPSDIDLVVGIPKSGMIPAMMIGLNLNVAVSDLDSMLEGRFFSHGFCRTHARQKNSLSECKKILIVDDSIRSGRSMKDAKKRVAESPIFSKSQHVLFMAAYCNSSNRDKVDIYCRECPPPRIFEWNIMHHVALCSSCVDIDGVLCPDPTRVQNDDGEQYLRFIEEVAPMFVPTQPINMLVTNRLEKYRGPTEKWLAKQGIIYDSLVMLDLPTQQARKASGANLGENKAKVYSESDNVLFIESDHKQAANIAKLSGKPVLSVENQFMFNPGELISLHLQESNETSNRRVA